MKILLLVTSLTLGACATTVQAPKSTEIVYKIISAGAAYCYHVTNLREVTPIKCTANVSLATQTIELNDLTYQGPNQQQEYSKEDKEILSAIIREID